MSRPLRLAVRVLADPDTGKPVGALVAASNDDAMELRRRKYRPGVAIRAELRQPRNPHFHRLAHAFGGMIAANIDDFAGMDAHAVIKRLQVESGIECDEQGVDLDAVWPTICTWADGIVTGAGAALQMVGRALSGCTIPMRVARSLSFDSMDESRFQLVMHAIARWVAVRYWPDCTPEQIMQMAEVFDAEGGV